MPFLDLTNSTGVRFNGADVSAVRLNGTDIWTSEPAPELYETSIFRDSAPSGYYTMQQDDGVTYDFLAGNFYTPVINDSGEDWVLTGMRLWIPSDEVFPIAEMSALGSLVVYPEGAISTPRNTPEQVIDDLHASPHKATLNSLHVGWNEARFSTPIPYPWHAGIAVGWIIGDGSVYVLDSFTHGTDPVGSNDPANPFLLSGVNLWTGDQQEKRGEYGTSDGTRFWAYEVSHYGSDLLVAKPIS